MMHGNSNIKNKKLSLGRTLERNASRRAMITLAPAFQREAHQVLLWGLRPYFKILYAL